MIVQNFIPFVVEMLSQIQSSPSPPGAIDVFQVYSQKRGHFEKRIIKKYLIFVYFVVERYLLACKCQLKVLKSYPL